MVLELGEELGPREVEQAVQAVLKPCGLNRESSARHRELTECRVLRVEEREAHELPFTRQQCDQRGVLGVGLERAVVLDLLRLLRDRGEHIHDRIAARSQKVRERVAMMTRELQADQQPLARCLGKDRAQVGIGCLKGRAADGHMMRLAPQAIAGASRNEHMKRLGRIDADSASETLRIAIFLVRTHGARLSNREWKPEESTREPILNSPSGLPSRQRTLHRRVRRSLGGGVHDDRASTLGRRGRRERA
jgi:hypothetical protein